jgi:NADPH:quinone reductase-like Zn-dependent oxidoreductase
MTRDGTHSMFLVLPTAALSRKPATVSLAAAATVGVPFITAYEGLRRAGLNGKGQRVIVFGANGKVGQAAIQLATRAGATVSAWKGTRTAMQVTRAARYAYSAPRTRHWPTS